MKAKILVVDDERGVLDSLEEILRQAGYEIETAEDAEEALFLYGEFQPDLIILDIKFGDNEREGLDILKDIRERWNDKTTPVIMLTVLSKDELGPLSFNLGATDFEEKTTSTRMLLARVKARLPLAMRETIVIDGYIEYDGISHSVKVKRNDKWQCVEFEPMEYRIFVKLVDNPGRVITREVLEDYFPDAIDPAATLNRYISELRKKLEPDPRHPKYILTKRGIGYRFKDYR